MRSILSNIVLITLIYWVTIICLSKNSFGQGEAKPTMHFDHLTINEGLSHNTVYCLLQDRHGYIWIGTQNGLNKYDGYTFETYRSSEIGNKKTGFKGKSISSLLEDSEGNLWVGTRKQGLNVRKKSSEQFINLYADSAFLALKDMDISALMEDGYGNIWITTVGAGVLKYSPNTKTSKHYTVENSDLSNNLVFDIVEDNYGTIWVGTANIGLNYLQKNGRFGLNLPEQSNINSYRKRLFLDGDDLWIATEGTGLFRLNVKTKAYQHFTEGTDEYSLNSNVVLDIQKGADGNIYLATDGNGLNVLNTNTNQVSKYTYKKNEPTALNSNALHYFFKDRTDNLWIGTYNGGINIHKPHKTWFEFFTPTSGAGDELENRSVLSLHQSKDGKIWVGTDGGGLNCSDTTQQNFSSFYFKSEPDNPNSIAGNVVKTIFEDSQNRLWIGTFAAGLDLYDSKNQSFQHFQRDYGNPNSLSSNHVWSIAERADGKLWIGTIGEGLNLFDPETAQFTIFKNNPADPHSLADASVMVVFVDKENQTWIGTRENGLDFWDERKEQFIHYRHDSTDSLSLSNNEVRAIFQDSQGELWIGTEGGGLNRWLGDGQFEHLQEKDGLIANSVMSITEDADNMIWVTTFEGISQINPRTKAIQNFDLHNQQNNNQFNQMAILATENGKLFFGGIHGLHAIHPEKIQENEESYPIIFTDFQVFSKSISAGELIDGRLILERPIEEAEHIYLNYSDNSFAISFSVIDYTSPLENQFFYKMEGFDSDWHETNIGQHSASYTNLNPGIYTFKVKHLDAEKTIKLHIKPPFWETLWFRILMAIVVSSLIIGSVFFVIKRREKVHQQQLLKAEREVLKLKNEKLQTDVSAKNSKLMFSAVQMAHKNEILTNVKEDLKTWQSPPDAAMRKLLRMIDKELESEDYWEEFNLYFNQVDQNFVTAMLKKHPELTKNDIRLCTLLRINLSTKEIASLLNISTRGVEKGRYRLKKRLELEKEEDLGKFVVGFES